MKTLEGKKLLILNTHNNRFNKTYYDYFQEDNDAKLLVTGSASEVTEALSWADICWSLWADEPMAHLNRLTAGFMDAEWPAIAVTIHSYEIFIANFMKGIPWKRVQGAIFVANHVRKHAFKMWEGLNQIETVATIYNGLHLSEWPFHSREDSDNMNIAYVGYLNYKKGISLLIQCIDRAVNMNANIRFHIVGTFQEERFRFYFEHLVGELGIADKITMHGWQEDIAGQLRGMDCVISTSPWEGCPYNVIEAMATGCRPLIHSWEGAAELFGRENTFRTLDEFEKMISNGPPNDDERRQYRLGVELGFNMDDKLPQISEVLAKAMEVKIR